MNPQPQHPRVRVGDPAGLLAIVPHLLGFVPQTSLVVLGAGPPDGWVQVALRYDLPDPPDTGTAAQIAAHAVAVLSRHQMATVIIAGYGPGPLVTPVADATRDTIHRAGLRVHDVLRVQDGRYWSYLCREPSCCPAEGVPFDAGAHPAAQVLAGTGQPVRADRDALAATIAPLTGSQANAMREATRWAQRARTRLITRAGPRALDAPGRSAVQAAIAAYRDGGSISGPGRHAWLALVLTSLPVRDDAWARRQRVLHLADYLAGCFAPSSSPSGSQPRSRASPRCEIRARSSRPEPRDMHSIIGFAPVLLSGAGPCPAAACGREEDSQAHWPAPHYGVIKLLGFPPSRRAGRHSQNQGPGPFRRRRPIRRWPDFGRTTLHNDARRREARQSHPGRPATKCPGCWDARHNLRI